MITCGARLFGCIIAVVLLALVVGAAIGLYPKTAGLHSPLAILTAVPLLALGMVAQFLVWHFSVKSLYPDVTVRATFISHSLTIWGKYVPGKIWSVVGRATLLARISQLPAGPTVYVSTVAQMTMVVTGFVVGLALVEVVNQTVQVPGLGYGMEALVLIAFSAVLLVILAGLVRNRLSNHSADRQAVGAAAISGLVAWSAWGVGFHQLSHSLGLETGWFADLGAFALASTAGIVSIVSPGGLGVREGALSALVVVQGVSVGEAAVLSLAARVWFVLGELMMFAAALAMNARMYVRVGERNEAGGQ